MTPPLLEKPLRIALLGYRSHPFVGGQGIYLKYLSRALAALGHQITVYSGQPYPELDSHITLIKVPGLNLYESPTPFSDLKLKHLTSISDTTEWLSKMTGGFAEPYCFGRRVAKLIAPNQYDFIHDNQSLSYGLLKLQKHTPVISTIHHPIHRDRQLAIADAPNKFHRLMRARWYRFLTMQQRVVDKLHFVTTVSLHSQKDIAHYFKRNTDNCLHIPNGIDTTLFSPNNQTPKHALQIMTTTSSDQPLKGLRFLLKAIAILKESYPSIRLVIVGALNKNGECAQLINTLNLNDSVFLVSKVSTKKLITLYRESNVVVCPSLYEGFGLPVAEAMACGCAVVSTDGGALPEIVGDAGKIVKAGDEHALALSVSALLSSDKVRAALEVKARERIVRLFSWQKVALSLSQTYTNIIAEKPTTISHAQALHTKLSQALPLFNGTAHMTPSHADD